MSGHFHPSTGADPGPFAGVILSRTVSDTSHCNLGTNVDELFTRNNQKYSILNPGCSGARGTVFGPGTVLQAGRLQVQFPARSLDFFS
jgi:hypothetical protein